MTSTSTGNRGAALPTQPYPTADTTAVGPLRLRQRALALDQNMLYSDSDKYSQSAGNLPLTFLGTPGNSWAAQEYGDNAERYTILTATAPIAITVASGAAALGVGLNVYTFPAVDVCIGAGSAVKGHMNAAVTPSATPVVGLGTVVASGVVSVLSGTATFQDVLVGQAMSNLNGTDVDFVDSRAVAKAASAPPNLYLNLANTWAASDTVTIPIGFEIHFHWRPMQKIEQSGYNFV